MDICTNDTSLRDYTVLDSAFAILEMIGNEVTIVVGEIVVSICVRDDLT
jgi:predicted transcriptional regulator